MPPSFLGFFLEDKTSAPDVFSSCSFILRAHFETSSVMVRYYGYELLRHKYQVVRPFLCRNTFFSTFFNNLSKSRGLNQAKFLFMCYFSF